MPWRARARLWLQGFRPAVAPVDRAEVLRSGAGALLGLLLTAVLARFVVRDVHAAVWLIAPMGASAVLLFAVPASPLAQPWSLLGGNLVAALVGVACQQWCPLPWLAPALAGGLAIGAMLALRCLHPPSGAVALTAVLGGPAIHQLGFGYVLWPVEANSLLLLSCALLFNPAAGRRYPHGPLPRPAGPLPPQAHTTGFSAEDLDQVLRRHHEVIDISREDLEDILHETEEVAFRRRFGQLSCAEMMDAEVPAVEFGTALEDAWRLLREGRLQALPVVDRARRVIGTVSMAEFVEHAQPERFAQVGPSLGQLIRRTFSTHSELPEVVGQIMNRRFWQVQATQPVIELVPLMREQKLAQLPVVDEQQRLVGLLTQAQVLDALYRTAGPLPPPP
ncbi:MAG: HPP family protein [Pseudomonadota bacterium]|nr:HPP family protein [Pseudomonadota bacterium]